MGKRDKTLDKYVFKVYQIDVDDEIRQHLYDLSIKELERTMEKEYSLIDYNPISDDTDHLGPRGIPVGPLNWADGAVAYK